MRSRAADAVVFAAGAGPGSGAERKRTVDLGGAVKLIEACRQAGVERYLMVSAMGVDRTTTRRRWSPTTRPSAEADEAVRASGLDYTIVRPGQAHRRPGHRPDRGRHAARARGRGDPRRRRRHPARRARSPAHRRAHLRPAPARPRDRWPVRAVTTRLLALVNLWWVSEPRLRDRPPRERAAAGLYRPYLRARRLRRRLRRAPRRPAAPRRHRPGADRARRPRAPRRRRRRPEHRRRRRGPDPAPPRLPALARRASSGSPAPSSPTRAASRSPAASSPATRALGSRSSGCSSRRWSRPASCRSAGARCRSTSRAAARPARDVAPRVPPAAGRRRRRRHRPGRVRAPPVRRPADRRARGRARALDPELQLTDARLQGDADRARSSRGSTPTCATPSCRARSPSSTRASRPTPSRAGSSPSRCGCSPTTARSTRSPATSTGCAPARRRCAPNLFGADLERCLPLIPDGSSDSAAFDRVLELLALAGRPLPQAMMMMIPAAHEHRDDMPPELEGFYRYSSSVIEPWDGPAAMAFSDGRVLGACLDRNGLRPGRWLVTDDGLVVLGSEAGVLPVDPAKVVRRGRLHPGRLFIVDLERGAAAGRRRGRARGRRGASPTARWCDEGEIRPRTTSPSATLAAHARAAAHPPARLRLLPGGPAGDDLAAPPRPGSSRPARWATTSRSRRSPSRSRRCSRYFKQRFAQVTNPPIDSVRESIVMSLESRIGSEGNLLSEGPEHAVQLVLDHPVLTNAELERVARASHPALRATTLDATWPLDDGEDGLEAALDRIAREASAAITGGANLIVISDRAPGPRPGADPVDARARRRPPAPGRARAPGCRPASWSRPASRARSTTSRR